MAVRVLSAIAYALIVVAVAVTPLSAAFRPGYFDVRYVDPVTRDVLNATIQDQTGLISAVGYPSDSPPTTSGLTSRLVVDLAGGCEDPSLFVRFLAVGERFRITHHTTGTMCELLFLQGRPFLFVLRAPIDASTVDVVRE